MNEGDNPLDLRGLVPPEPLLPAPGWPSWAWFALAAAVLLVALAVVIVFRLARREKAMSGPSLLQAAYREAVAALKQVPENRIQESATWISSALRTYLARACSEPALYETHEEFVCRTEALATFPEELREETSRTFSLLARLKYGPDAQGDPRPLAENAREILEKLHQHVRPA